MKQIQMGALYMGKKVQINPTNPVFGGNIPQYDGKRMLRIGKAPGDGNQCRTLITWNVMDEMWSWSKTGTLLIADRVLALGFDKLAMQSAFHPHTVTLDGQSYLARFIPVGAPSNHRRALHHNAWDAALDQYGVDDTLWHWQGVSFWGTDRSDRLICRGETHPRDWRERIDARFCGFRPALEPLGVEMEKLPPFGQTLCQTLGVRPGEPFRLYQWTFAVLADGFLYKELYGAWKKLNNHDSLLSVVNARDKIVRGYNGRLTLVK